MSTFTVLVKFEKIYLSIISQHLMNYFPQHIGWIEVICGSMFSGKSEELIRRLRRAEIARQKIQVFKPKIDDRYDINAVVSHSTLRIDGVAVQSPADILERLEKDAVVVGIDEIQFFGPEIVEVCNQLANKGLRVICAGLDQDYRGEPFGPMPRLMAIAEYVTKSMAVCMVCGNPANRTQRLVANQELVVVGASDGYEARCRRCHEVPSVV